MPHYLKNQDGCVKMNDQYPNSKFVWRDGKCDKVEGYINTKEHFNHNDKLEGYMNTKEHFGHPEKRNEQDCLNMNTQFPGSMFVWKDGQCDKVEGNFDHKGVSDKGTSDKSTGTGFSDVRNANYLRKVYLLHILLVFPLFIFYGCLGKHFKVLGRDSCRWLGWILLSFMGYSLLKSEITGNWNWDISHMFDFKMKQDKRNAMRLRIVYLFHLLIVAPLLLYISRHNKKVDEKALGSICILGVLAFFYHGYSYWRSETTGEWNWMWGN